MFYSVDQNIVSLIITIHIASSKPLLLVKTKIAFRNCSNKELFPKLQNISNGMFVSVTFDKVTSSYTM